MAKQPKKPFGERKHAGNPAVVAAREHYATRARRRTVRQAWDPASRTWANYVDDQPRYLQVREAVEDRRRQRNRETAR